MEEINGIVRIYLVSGDIEEVDEKSFMSAIISSGAGYMKMENNHTPVSEIVFDKEGDKAIAKGVSDLSDGSLVPAYDIATGKENAVVEGSDVSESDEVSPYPRTAIYAKSASDLSDGSLVPEGDLAVGKDNAIVEGSDVSTSDEVSPYPASTITAEEILRVIQLVKSGKLDGLLS